VALLRRLIFASASDAPAKVSRSEAEMLFRLKDATLGADNSPDWKRLFVQGVANYLMAHQPYEPPSPEEAARLEQVRRPDPFSNVLARLGRKPVGGWMNVLNESEEPPVESHHAAVARDAAVTSDEMAWLEHLLENDGARDPLEQALLDFLAEEGARPS
jgi:hypothetical protein